MNDRIPIEHCIVSYVSIDDIIQCILSLGRGSLPAKMDIKEAYCIVAVHPEDRHLLAVRWKGITYVDKVLPLGLRSSAIIFSAVADTLQWLMERRGAKHIFHYVDDFIAVGRPQLSECAETLAIMKATCNESRLPLRKKNVRGQLRHFHS